MSQTTCFEYGYQMLLEVILCWVISQLQPRSMLWLLSPVSFLSHTLHNSHGGPTQAQAYTMHAWISTSSHSSTDVCVAMHRYFSTKYTVGHDVYMMCIVMRCFKQFTSQQEVCFFNLYVIILLGYIRIIPYICHVQHFCTLLLIMHHIPFAACTIDCRAHTAAHCREWRLQNCYRPFHPVSLGFLTIESNT